MSDVPVFWFVGNGDKPLNGEPNVIALDCGDKYDELIGKTRAMVRWALDQGYDYVFCCDTDTFVAADKLLKSGFEQNDYVGWTRGRSYAQGGSGYWLSRKAMTALVTDTTPTPETIWEDLHVGTVLARHGITPHHDERYLVGPQNCHLDMPKPGNEIITVHYVRFDAQWERIWQNWKK